MKLEAGDVHLVVHPAPTPSWAKLKLFVAQGATSAVGRTWFVLCEGVRGDDWRERGADTPPGFYEVGRPEYVDGTDRVAFGPAWLPLEPLSGLVLETGRAGLGIHGGGTGVPGAETLLSQRLVPTLGCIRMHNGDLLELVGWVRMVHQLGHRVFLSVSRS